MPPLSAIAGELLRVLLGNEDGVSDEQLKAVFGARYELLAPAINELLTLNRVQLFTQGSALVYKAIKEEIAQKFEGLGYDPFPFTCIGAFAVTSIFHSCAGQSS